MKKFMIGLLFIILLSTTLSANAETVVLKANSYDKIRDAYFDYHNIHVLSNQEGNFFWWTGTEFIQCSGVIWILAMRYVEKFATSI